MKVIDEASNIMNKVRKSKLAATLGVALAFAGVSSCEVISKETTVQVIGTGEYIPNIYSRAMYNHVEVGDTVILELHERKSYPYISRSLWGKGVDLPVTTDDSPFSYKLVVVKEKY